MKIFSKLKNHWRLLTIISILVILTFIVPYITIPGIILWWFYKKSRFSKKFKIIATSSVVGLFVLLVGWISVLYAKDPEPHLTITEPAIASSIKAPQITIKGTYSPADRTVKVNGSKIAASNGTFEYTYQLKEGDNKIDVKAGNWKWVDVNLTVTRELTDVEIAARITPTPSPTATIIVTNSPIPSPTKTTSSVQYSSGYCHSINGRPDLGCTPGVANPNVTQANIYSTICVSGYTTTIRPSTSYTNALKTQQIREYGYTDTNLSDYEEDHLIPLEVGGDPTNPKNLWPEYGKIPNPKDSIENLCHSKVCSGQISLAEAQKEIVTDWYTACGGNVSTSSNVNPPITATTSPQTSTSTQNNGATALCNDGTYSYAANHQGACSHHGGVAQFYK